METKERQRGSEKAAVPAEVAYAAAGCSLGAVLVAGTDVGVCAVLLGDDEVSLVAELGRRFPESMLRQEAGKLNAWLARAVEMVERPAAGFDAPLDARGTVFQRRVWQALREIPSGSTASYSDIALRIGRPGSVRAVAGACAANPLAIAVPCHRVVRSDGELAGYRWGVERKRALLAREAVA